MIPRLRPLVLVLTLAAAACSRGDALVDPRFVEDAALAVQRQVWERQGIDDYRVSYTLGCYCPHRGTAQLTVRDGRVIDAVQVAGVGHLPPDAFEDYPTVETLFDRIRSALARGEPTSVSYHPTLGYPTEVRIGTMENDSGTYYSLQDLVRID